MVIDRGRNDWPLGSEDSQPRGFQANGERKVLEDIFEDTFRSRRGENRADGYPASQRHFELAYLEPTFLPFMDQYLFACGNTGFFRPIEIDVDANVASIATVERDDDQAHR